MRSRNVVVLCSLLIGVALLPWLIRSREPEYGGKSVGEWVRIYDMDAEGPAQSTDTPACHEAVQAVRHVRDQAMVRALQLLQSEKPAWKSRVESAMERMNIRQWGPRFIWVPFYGDPGDDAPIYFEMLGPTARPAIPALIRIATESQSYRVTQRAISSLSGIGGDALPALMRMVRDGPNRREAICAIDQINHDCPQFGRPAVPILVACLHAPDVELASAAATVLGNFHPDGDSVSAALVESLRSTNAYLRSCAAESLRKLGPKARSALPSLVTTLGDSEYSVRAAATNAITVIAPEFFTKRPRR